MAALIRLALDCLPRVSIGEGDSAISQTMHDEYVAVAKNAEGPAVEALVKKLYGEKTGLSREEFNDAIILNTPVGFFSSTGIRTWLYNAGKQGSSESTAAPDASA
jgi:hypothetical protein